MNNKSTKLTWQEEEEFCLEKAEKHRGLYFPLMSESGLKSSVTPDLRGDAKTDQNHFLMEPASIENLTENMSSRNFWCDVTDEEGDSFLWSATGCSHESRALIGTENEETVKISAGFLWHRALRESKEYGLSSDITSFIPHRQNTEIHIVTIKNNRDRAVDLRATSAIPLYGRSADNLRDHRHVTSLLHRIRVRDNGVFLTPTMSFDERGHKLNDTVYFAVGIDEDGEKPESFYPTVSDFVGEEGDLFVPMALLAKDPGRKPGYSAAGYEALGGLSFKVKRLLPGQECTFVLGAGMGDATDFPGSLKEAKELLAETKSYWKDKLKIRFSTGDSDLDGFLRWVSFQPEMRRVFGCSFLPHHDYGRGGRGWRDLWQDCLGLLLQNPGEVRSLLVNNCGGIRIDGTNATIIGDKPGEFKADRNAIARVWMDHAMWPLMTVKLYIDETGDLSILDEKAPYFKDNLICRGEKRDPDWDGSDTLLRTPEGEVYFGSVLEHLLIENLMAVSDVGEHGLLRLRDADWNDAIDMAGEFGESVAFTFAYVKNLYDLSGLLQMKGDLNETITLPGELLETVRPNGSGDANVTYGELIDVLEARAGELSERLQKEWLTTEEGLSYFNSYYDNSKNRVEGFRGANGILRMMLTGQVFAVMSGVADEDQVKSIIQSANSLLYDKSCGGYRLNSDFGEVKTDMGRMFGFAYGEKENGAVFSHMAVMYANALYTRGEKEAGALALLSLYRQAMDNGISHIYPGIPEYFDQRGRGLYHYLTGAASWYLLTMRTRVLGVRGSMGDLVIDPMLTDDFFKENRVVKMDFPFRGIKFRLCVERNEDRAGEVLLDEDPAGRIIEKEVIDGLDKNREHGIWCFVR